MILHYDSMPLELLDIPASKVFIRQKSKAERQYIKITENMLLMYSTIERGDVMAYGQAILIERG